MVMLAKQYVGASRVSSEAGGARTLGLSTNERRPVRFHARIARHVYPLRLALQTLGELVWSDTSWLSEEEYGRYLEQILDPVITVHPDRVFFEAFSQDQSAYGLVVANREIFEAEGEVACGTTNIDFTRVLWEALGEMRSSRETWFRVGPMGFAVETAEAGAHYEAKVDLPDDWVRGFLQLQGAMSMPGTRIVAQPVDVLNALQFLERNRAYTSPRSIRYEFEPGRDARMVLEPWNEVIELEGAAHDYDELKVTRTWGRRRLNLIKALLPYAVSVEIYLKGRALPSFYAVELPGVTFVLGLSGWTANNWTQAASFDLLSMDGIAQETVERVARYMRAERAADEADVASALELDLSTAHRALTEMCRLGRAIYDVRDREFRHRELFETPIDPARFYPPDPRKEAAEELVARGVVTVDSNELREVRKFRHGAVAVLEDRVLDGRVDGETVHLVLKSTDQIIFGRCTCAFFDENLMHKGPCEHMLALRAVARS